MGTWLHLVFPIFASHLLFHLVGELLGFWDVSAYARQSIVLWLPSLISFCYSSGFFLACFEMAGSSWVVISGYGGGLRGRDLCDIV